MNLDVQIDGVEASFEFDRQDDGEYRFRLASGEQKRAHMIQVEPHLFSVLVEGHGYQVSYEVGVEPAEDGAWVTVRGRRFRVTISDPRRWNPKNAGRAVHGRESILAPMPGKIVRLLVAPGDSVEAGQGIIVIEAMKMQNELKARRGGRVVALPVREGETVAAGAVLATFE